MGVGAGVCRYVVVVQKFTFAISSPDEFLLWKGLGPHLTQTRLGWSLPPYRVACWCTQPFALATIDRNGPKIVRGLRAPFLGRGAGSQSIEQCSLDQGPPVCQVPSWTIQPFGHNGRGPKIGEGDSAPFSEGELGPRAHLTQSRLDRVLPPYQVASWSIQPFGHNRYGPKPVGTKGAVRPPSVRYVV